MEILLIIVAMIVIAILVYGQTRLINLTKNTVYSENKYVQELYKKISKLNVETKMLVTIFEFLISGVTVELFLGLFERYILKISDYNITYITSKSLSILFLTIASTYITMIIGTYIPKHLVHMRKKHKFNDIIIMYIYGALTYIFYPLTLLSTYLDNRVREKVDSSNNDVEEIKEFTNKGLEKGSITPIEKEIIENTVSSLDQNVYKICTKIENVICVKVTDEVNSIIRKLAKGNVSRALIYDKKELLGFVHIKDLLLNEDALIKEAKNIKSLIRKPAKLSMNESAQKCLKKMKQEKSKFAIVVDIKDEIVGIVTLGDIVEELIGKLKEE